MPPPPLPLTRLWFPPRLDIFLLHARMHLFTAIILCLTSLVGFAAQAEYAWILLGLWHFGVVVFNAHYWLFLYSDDLQQVRARACIVCIGVNAAGWWLPESLLSAFLYTDDPRQVRAHVVGTVTRVICVYLCASVWRTDMHTCIYPYIQANIHT
jgi:hypothetical protein